MNISKKNLNNFYYSEKVFLLQNLYKYFIQYILKKGKKYKVEKIFISILYYIVLNFKGKFIFKNIIDVLQNTTPKVSVKTKRKGSKNIYIPIKITKKRAQYLSYNWIVSCAKIKPHKNFYINFTEELVECLNKKSASVKKCNSLHDLAENSIVYLKGKLN
jgi:ribosomal protein S7